VKWWKTRARFRKARELYFQTHTMITMLLSPKLTNNS